MDYPYLVHPFRLLVCGPSHSGKTHFVKRILETKIIQPLPSRIIWCYGVYQKIFEEIPEVEFHEGLPNDFQKISNSLVIIDDLMNEMGNNRALSNLFIRNSHHNNISVIFIVQNMFHKGKEMRNISLNSSYICCFKNVRDKLQIACLARQIYPQKVKFFLESFEDATAIPFGYLFLDLRGETPEALRLRSGIFPEDKNAVYLPR